jgi:hypothetical protein
VARWEIGGVRGWRLVESPAAHVAREDDVGAFSFSRL